MIRVNYLREEDTHKLSVQGHAGYATHGDDIVCAGVSAISYALLGFLHDAGCSIEKAQTASGEMIIECERDCEIDPGFDMAMIGYLQIAKKYPQHVDVYIARTAG